MKYFYIDEEEAKKGISCVCAFYDEKIEDYKKFFEEQYGVNVIEFIGEELPHFITYDEKNRIVREATLEESYNRGDYTLSSNEYYKDGFIKTIPPCPDEIYIGKFNPDTEEWEETATIEEISQKEFNKSVEFYNKELEYASKATAEFACDIIDQSEFNEVKSYMRSIDPYSKRTLIAKVSLNRPNVFMRYI